MSGFSDAIDQAAAEASRAAEQQQGAREDRWRLVYERFPLLRAGFDEFLQTVAARGIGPTSVLMPKLNTNPFTMFAAENMKSYQCFAYESTFTWALLPDGRWFLANPTRLDGVDGSFVRVDSEPITSPEILFIRLEELLNEITEGDSGLDFGKLAVLSDMLEPDTHARALADAVVHGGIGRAGE